MDLGFRPSAGAGMTESWTLNPLSARAARLKGPAFAGFLTKTRPSNNEGATVQVLVRDNNVDQALKALKKKMQREGIFREMKLRGHYEKPSEKKAREKAEAIRRARKLARKKMQREGLLPMKPRVVPGAAGPGGAGGPSGGGRGRSGGGAPRF
jgi:small subunit ribosomal protein S21